MVIGVSSWSGQVACEGYRGITVAAATGLPNMQNMISLDFVISKSAHWLIYHRMPSDPPKAVNEKEIGLFFVSVT